MRTVDGIEISAAWSKINKGMGNGNGAEPPAMPTCGRASAPAAHTGQPHLSVVLDDPS